MTINTSWKVEIGTVASPTDFTSRVMSMSINQQVDVNVIGRGQCVITLLNKDGALTPGGGGTYSTTDWFAQGVFINALTNTGGADTVTDVFDGIITSFNLVDDGVFSTVTITAQDWLTVGGKSTPSSVPAGSTSYNTLLGLAFDTTSYGVMYLPRLGAASTGTSVGTLGGTNPSIVNDATQTYSTYADFWQTSVITSANDVFWPTTITSNPEALYSARGLPMTNTRDLANRVDFVFDPYGSVSGTDLPFDINDFEQAFNNDTLISQTIIQGNYSGAASVTSTASTTTSYGSRTVAFTETFVANATAASDMATKLTNRYSTSRFNPVSLVIRSANVKVYSVDAAEPKWAALLSIVNGLWQKATITWVGSGAASQTANCVIKSRQIDVTPSDTFVKLTLGNWSDNHSFILDTDQLDTDRLG
jgi:hypothetical protein